MTECRGGNEADLSCAPDVLHSCKAEDTWLSRLGAAAQHTLGNWRLRTYGRTAHTSTRAPDVLHSSSAEDRRREAAASAGSGSCAAACSAPAARQRWTSRVVQFQTLGTEVAEACIPLVSFSLHTPKVWEAPTAGLHSHKGGNAAAAELVFAGKIATADNSTAV